jgi:hypothetical protein
VENGPVFGEIGVFRKCEIFRNRSGTDGCTGGEIDLFNALSLPFLRLKQWKPQCFREIDCPKALPRRLNALPNANSTTMPDAKGKTSLLLMWCSIAFQPWAFDSATVSGSFARTNW